MKPKNFSPQCCFKGYYIEHSWRVGWWGLWVGGHESVGWVLWFGGLQHAGNLYGLCKKEKKVSELFVLGYRDICVCGCVGV